MMQKTKIEWVSNLDGTSGYTWNPITGCNGECDYCYARRISMRFVGHFKPTFHPERLDEPKKIRKPSKIFADSMSDFWGNGTYQTWRDKVYDVMKRTPHTYYLLTKQPQNIHDWEKHPKNLWVGVSISKYEDRWRIPILFNKGPGKIFVSLEPILDEMVPDDIYLTDWIIIGCLTGCKNLYRPPKETIKNIINTCKRLKIPLFIKDNVGWHERIQEFG